MSEPPRFLLPAAKLPVGRALDLACGKGRSALWLARLGWRVTAVDVSADAIAGLRSQAAESGVSVDARVADLEKGEYSIKPASWDLITICCYLQRDLFEPAKRGLVPGGICAASVLLVEPGKENSPFRAASGELREYFASWQILHDREGADDSHRAVAEIMARRPLQ